MHGRDQDRRPRPQPPLRTGPADGRRHPRRRGHRRGRHGQRPNDRLHPRAARRRGRPRARGGARRGLLPPRFLRRLQRRPARGRRQRVRQSAQRRRRLAAAEGPAGDGRQAAGLRRPRPRRALGGARADRRAPGHPAGDVRGLPGVGPARLALHATRRDVGGGRSLRRALRRRALHAGPRGRRRGLQNRLARRTGPPGQHLAGPSVGGRLQVPSRGGGDPPARHRRAGRPHRPGHSLRCHEARSRRRLDGRPGHLAQPLRGGAQGSEDRGHGRRPEGRGHHPRGPRPRRCAARRDRAGLAHARAVPVVRCAARPRQGGRRRRPLPQHRLVPGAACSAHRLHRRARGSGRRGARRRDRSVADRSRQAPPRRAQGPARRRHAPGRGGGRADQAHRGRPRVLRRTRRDRLGRRRHRFAGAHPRRRPTRTRRPRPPDARPVGGGGPVRPHGGGSGRKCAPAANRRATSAACAPPGPSRSGRRGRTGRCGSPAPRSRARRSSR